MKLPPIGFLNIVVVSAQSIQALDVTIAYDLRLLSHRMVECSLAFFNSVHSLFGVQWDACFYCESNSIKIVHGYLSTAEIIRHSILRKDIP